ncbi:MAG TPA: hypothetical protein VE954_02925 [Oligoflexus sp.]|uniref:hypothetical protein n=1 Tax=Oligoflexus sp. TaxID=1971216 RepID=UPI002D3C34FF|nr:hypothetical protein [Oligoflexus sp.]HYX32040.1 hypothetical protein [Oligoflexus sp.]
MTLHPVWSFLIISILGMVATRSSAADSTYDDMTIPESYPNDYIFALYSHNEPVGPSHSELRTHENTPGFSYQHRLGHPWVVGVGYRSQAFINRQQNRPVSLLTVFNTTQRLFRLYHPFYALAGTEILYLIPVQKLNPPITKDATFSTEIGIGAAASLWYVMSQNSVLALDLQRWRGTKTDRLHGVSMTLGLGWGF